MEERRRQWRTHKILHKEVRKYSSCNLWMDDVSIPLEGEDNLIIDVDDE